MAKKEGLSYEEVVRDIQQKQYKPIYCLMGEESYYVDLIADHIARNVLTEEERDFNQTLLFGADVTAADVANRCRCFPMGAPYQVVIVKEAQQMKTIEDLFSYAQNPASTTILVLCYKNGTLDRRKKLLSAISKCGVIFESKALRDYQLPPFIKNYLQGKGLTIDADACFILADHVGSDLCRLAGELDKLIITMPQGETRVTPSLVERNIGISKNYNDFELVNALVEHDIYKAVQITKYFYNNPKSCPIQKTLPTLFGFFSDLMLAFYAPQRTPAGIAEWLDVPGWRVERNILPAMRHYNGVKVMQILGRIRETDGKTKGIGFNSTTPVDHLTDLIYFILH